MDPQELRGLMEAYAEVYAPIEELYKGKHGQSETEYMDSRSDAGKQISGTSKLSGAAYSHRSYKGVGGPAKPGQRQQHQGKMTPADRNELAIRKANLKKEELEQVGEAVKGESSERRKDLAAERKAGHRPLPAKEGEKYASYKMSQMAYAKRKRMGEEVSVFDVVLEFLQAEGYAETLEEAEWMMANIIDEEAIEIILGEGKVKLDQERRSRMGRQIGKKVRSADAEYSLSKDTMYPKGLRDAMEKGARKKVGQAQKIMGALKSAQKEEYVDESQHARENPEKYEAGQNKKSAPVRGEKTPMPPRGDKRREDFEKWYAANVR
jgi:hypothetical protein